MADPAPARLAPEHNGSRRGETRPLHVAIVCDGSARWAHAHGLSIREGHEAAADTVLERIEDAVALGIAQLTLYAFSTENWARPAAEVRALFGMLARRIAAGTPALHARHVRVRFIGRRDRATGELLEAIEQAERTTAANDGLALFIAVDYGGRDEIVSAAARYSGGGERAFAQLLGAPGMRDPDLLIRTSGERRLSNFLLWQAAYSELMFCGELWPEFTAEAFEQCLAEYARRSRRFGGRSEHAVAEARMPHQ